LGSDPVHSINERLTEPSNVNRRSDPICAGFDQCDLVSPVLATFVVTQLESTDQPVTEPQWMNYQTLNIERKSQCAGITVSVANDKGNTLSSHLVTQFLECWRDFSSGILSLRASVQQTERFTNTLKDKETVPIQNPMCEALELRQ